MVPMPDDLLVLGDFLEDGEHHVLTSHGGGALDAHVLCHLDEFGGGFLLQVFEDACTWSGLGQAAVMETGR